MADHAFVNRLAKETSPYLLQHAHNPVDWYPWGEEALNASKDQGKPIFLSIGYSACHWCHVMERESFEDPATAAIMNRHFINIKVDREERPDLDQIYMTAVQLITRHGGWPMSVWLTPDLEPFYGGTYFPPEPRYNMPSFQHVLERLAEVWAKDREQIVRSAGELTSAIRDLGGAAEGSVGPTVRLIEQGARQLLRIADPRFGGIGQAPKFPHSVEMRLLLRAWKQAGIDQAHEIALLSLEKMIFGGIYDQIGGGFHRYSTDERWLAPHFEKMLYDNALIPLACLEAYQASGRPVFRRACVETLDYVLREMTSPEGPFYSTQDADSEGVEGKFFVWSKKEVIELLGPEKGEVFCYCYDVTPEGNWEHSNILNLPKPIDQCAKLLNLPDAEILAILAEGRCKLFGARALRIAPGRDEKSLTAWNGMMIDTMAVVGRALEKPAYVAAAAAAATFILERLRQPNGLFYRTYKEGQAKLNAYLEDYAFLASGLVSLYEATFEPKWIDAALDVATRMVEQFWDEAEGGFYFTGKDHEALIVRNKDANDNATPSGNSMAVTALARLAKLTGRADLIKVVDRTLKVFAGVMERSPISAAQMMIGMALHQGPTLEIAIVGEPDAEETKAVLREIDRRYLPNKVVAVAPIGAPASAVALLEGKTGPAGATSVFICQNFACQAPVVGAEALARELDRLGQSN